MDEASKELMDLLGKLKTMRPEGGEAPAAPVEEKPAEKPSPAKKEKTPKAAKKPAQLAGALTSEIYKKIIEVEADIRKKEGIIDLDLKKLDDLVKSLSKREVELLAKESELAEKDAKLTKELDDLRRVREGLQKVLQ